MIITIRKAAAPIVIITIRFERHKITEREKEQSHAHSGKRKRADHLSTSNGKSAHIALKRTAKEQQSGEGDVLNRKTEGREKKKRKEQADC